MKNIFNSKLLPIFVTLLGLIGFLLRLWTLGDGPDAEGLYAAAPLAWVLLWIVTAAVPVLIIAITWWLREPGKYSDNFPPSPIAATGTVLGALGILVTAIGHLSNNQETFAFITGLLGLVAGGLLIAAAFARLKGSRPSFFCHASVCLFFAVQIFYQCRLWSNEPQITVFLFRFLAQVCVMLAAYQLCAFDADLGRRRPSLFWSLMSVYLCLLAMGDNQNLLFYGCMAIWLLTNLCSLRPIKKRKANTAPPANPVQAQMSSNDVSIDEIRTWLDEE